LKVELQDKFAMILRYQIATHQTDNMRGNLKRSVLVMITMRVSYNMRTNHYQGNSRTNSVKKIHQPHN